MLYNGADIQKQFFINLSGLLICYYIVLYEERKEKEMNEAEKIGYLEDDFKIFHLSDRQRKDFSFHYHDFNKILILISGKINYCIEGKNYELKPYDIVLVNAGEMHKPVVLDNTVYERIIIYVSTKYLNNYKNDEYDLSYCFERARKEQSSVLRIPSVDRSKLYQVCLELEQSFLDQDFAKVLYQNILFLELMIQLNRTAISNHINYLGFANGNSKLVPILEYINKHLTEEITIDTLAEHFYISRFYLMHYFKEETGYTIGNYISEKRLLLAKNLVQNGCSITEACYQSGFKNYSTFSRAFKKTFNTIPKNAALLD